MGAADTRNIDRRNIRVVEITARGDYWFQGGTLPSGQLEAELVRDLSAKIPS